MTAVHPPERFGELQIKGNLVDRFKEKPQLQQGWINGGFFVIEPSFLQFITDDSTILEKEPLEKLSKENQLVAFKHDNFWYPMDTMRDKNLLNEFNL